ncbi:hypothetical protein M758_1G007400 [Ceratodon purpureus]|uniref:Uncharacterized protein n=1 Tax=Ceratodon purpureus TaxID=3225 RepID=A0A8T0J2T2_CERPU|nr:hypothetical protein KC19_1G008600 [Ceratodon purpureus]KAG0589269.1 hypothetical protein KC19_1G008600 [Ceratodon purpureus]KAG0628185.1 hypothetical protein M758_1G007400 [Ceratodon purpureus]KAG0628186.1 hypothetical protein M758_1G007400 [Ceratodon purpureus]
MLLILVQKGDYTELWMRGIESIEGLDDDWALMIVSGVESRGVTSLLNLDGGMGKKACKNLFETDLRKERLPYMDADDLRWSVDMNSGSKFGAEKLLPAGFPMELFHQPAVPTAPKMNRVDSYRVPPLKMTLETIEEDKPGYEKPDSLLRSKSLPTQRRFPMNRNGLLLSRMPSYRPGQEGGHLAEDGGHRAGDHGYSVGDGTYFAGDGNFRAGDQGGYGVSMSGPILSTPSEYKYTRKSHRSRLSITKMREAIRHSRLRGAFSHILSRMRPSSGRSH